MKKRILLVEDDDLLRLGLKSIIQAKKEYSIEADTASGKQALRLFDANHPDIVLLDLLLPDISGIEVLRHIKRVAPKVPVVVLTAHEENELLFEALEWGANCYVLKGAGPEELFLGIHYALLNEMFISPKLAKLIVEAYLFVNRQRKALPPLNELTAREREIVKLIIDGKKSKEIADTLFISVKTVHKHRSNILEKLGLSNLADLRQRKMYVLTEMYEEDINK
ncbi:DNA-binding NarL/FixJ family response regulator [Desulfomicrobium macestii]|uniref:DNA-binding response regulator, NarL/FixJ family, contains REC and HTH domains n=2 Tax=Desulfomicrobium TaxID=898 RepID=A0A8G2C602_DESNO|nr:MULTISPECIES: response regulator transcription factor [Desulfomicrobium]MBE1426504.1 DNA-binding NarL/FixJ family response regulator [Desulfomicrobium macestii]SFM18625.1 DNA-binding response regulator, NarL/FixJ family, contains REC and HTH domains [Desulfomicrobium norvegicum]